MSEGSNLSCDMRDIAFYAVQGVFWCFVIMGWVRICRSGSNARSLRQHFSQGSLVCASLSLLFTTVITIYIRVGQKKPYDELESTYLLLTIVLSLAGLALGAFGKTAPRFIGLCTSAFTLLLALLDGISI